jgi:hypothetical protein
MEILKQQFKEALIKIWEENSIKDYENLHYFREDPLKCRLYMQLVNKLKDDFFIDNNLRLLTEYHISELNKTADMALVDISNNNYKDWRVLSILELKNKYLNTRTQEKIKEDYVKLLSYREVFPEIDLFMISVNEKVASEHQGSSWASIFRDDWHNKRFTELVLDDSENELESRIYDWHYKSNNSKKILNYIKLNEDICDDCLSNISKVTPRQQVNQICNNNLKDYIIRDKGICSKCNKNKIINILKKL